MMQSRTFRRRLRLLLVLHRASLEWFSEFRFLRDSHSLPAAVKFAACLNCSHNFDKEIL